MKFTHRARGIVQAIAVVLSLAMPLMLASRRGRRPGWRWRQFGFARIADVFRAAEHVYRAERGQPLQSHHYPAGQSR